MTLKISSKSSAVAFRIMGPPWRPDYSESWAGKEGKRTSDVRRSKGIWFEPLEFRRPHNHDLRRARISTFSKAMMDIYERLAVGWRASISSGNIRRSRDSCRAANVRFHLLK